MIRSLFTIGSAFSLLLCVGTVVLWAHSYTASETCSWCRETWEISLSASRGRVAFYWVEPSNDEGSNYHVGFRHAHIRPAAGFDLYMPQGVGTNWAVFDGGGFSLVGGQWDELRHWSLVVPCWFLVVMLASLTAFRYLWATRATCDQALCQCSRCGYDLRASKDRCPECGTAIPQKSGATG